MYIYISYMRVWIHVNLRSYRVMMMCTVILSVMHTYSIVYETSSGMILKVQTASAIYKAKLPWVLSWSTDWWIAAIHPLHHHVLEGSPVSNRKRCRNISVPMRLSGHGIAPAYLEVDYAGKHTFIATSQVLRICHSQSSFGNLHFLASIFHSIFPSIFHVFS